jgi:hypothetical protein
VTVPNFATHRVAVQEERGGAVHIATEQRIARDSRYFQFLANCGNHPNVVLADARLTIGNAP